MRRKTGQARFTSAREREPDSVFAVFALVLPFADAYSRRKRAIDTDGAVPSPGASPAATST